MKVIKESPTLECRNCKHQWRARRPFEYCPRCKSKKKPIGDIPESVQCKVCDYKWVPRLGTPNFCPKCTSSRWNGGPPLKKRGRKPSQDQDKKLIKEILALHEDGIEPPQRVIARTLGVSPQKVASIIKREVKVKNEYPMEEFIELIFSPKYNIDFSGGMSIMDDAATSGNQERDKEIVLKRDEMTWSFRRIANHYNLDFDAVVEIYQREGGTNSSNSFCLDLSTEDGLMELEN